MDWIGLHWVGCVAFHICVALDDWIVWIEWMSIGLHWSWIGLDWNLIIMDWVEYGFGWVGLDCIGFVVLRFWGMSIFHSVKNFLIIGSERCVSQLRCFDICVAIWIGLDCVR